MRWAELGFDVVFATVFAGIASLVLGTLAQVVLPFAPTRQPIPRDAAERALRREREVAHARAFEAGERGEVRAPRWESSIFVPAGECIAVLATTWGGPRLRAIAVDASPDGRADRRDSELSSAYVEGLVGHVQWCAHETATVYAVAQLDVWGDDPSDGDPVIHWEVLRASETRVAYAGGSNRGWLRRGAHVGPPSRGLPTANVPEMLPPGGVRVARGRRAPRIVAGPDAVVIIHRPAGDPADRFAFADGCVWNEEATFLVRPLADAPAPPRGRCTPRPAFALRTLRVDGEPAVVACRSARAGLSCALWTPSEERVVMPVPWRSPREAGFAWDAGALHGAFVLDAGVGIAGSATGGHSWSSLAPDPPALACAPPRRCAVEVVASPHFIVRVADEQGAHAEWRGTDSGLIPGPGAGALVFPAEDTLDVPGGGRWPAAVADPRANGVRLLVFTDAEPEGARVRVARVDPTRNVLHGPALALSSEGSIAGRGVIDASGDRVVVAWEESRDGVWEIRAAELR